MYTRLRASMPGHGGKVRRTVASCVVALTADRKPTGRGREARRRGEGGRRGVSRRGRGWTRRGAAYSGARGTARVRRGVASSSLPERRYFGASSPHRVMPHNAATSITSRAAAPLPRRHLGFQRGLRLFRGYLWLPPKMKKKRSL